VGRSHRTPSARYRPSGAIPSTPAESRAVALGCVLRPERGPAPLAFALATAEAPTAAAVSVECGCAVRADDAKVAEPIVIAHAVDVVEDQAHRAAAPVLVLATQLADRTLQPLLVETLLQVVARISGVLDEDLFERPPRARSLEGRVRVEMLRRYPPERGVLPEDLGCPARRAHPEAAEGLCPRAGFFDRPASLSLSITRTSGHEHMFVNRADGTRDDSEPRFEP
jgi:hypothetical protein